MKSIQERALGMAIGILLFAAFTYFHRIKIERAEEREARQNGGLIRIIDVMMADGTHRTRSPALVLPRTHPCRANRDLECYNTYALGSVVLILSLDPNYRLADYLQIYNKEELVHIYAGVVAYVAWRSGINPYDLDVFHGFQLEGDFSRRNSGTACRSPHESIECTREYIVWFVRRTIKDLKSIPSNSNSFI